MDVFAGIGRTDCVAGEGKRRGEVGDVKKKPVLVVMAAGMGSRYGGLKQLDAMDEDGHIIMDYTIFDAKRAGFEEVVFIIKEEFEPQFEEVIGRRIRQVMKVTYVYQKLTNLPQGYAVPEGREKPFGTGHALLCCKGVVDGPFAVVNADDYYGPEALRLIYQYLCTHEDNEKYQYVLAGYLLGKTLTDNGTVSRGVCSLDAQGNLQSLVERTKIQRSGEGVIYFDDATNEWMPISQDSLVSLNLFGFTKSMLEELECRFPAFLEKGLRENPLKCEYFLPSVVSELMHEDKATVHLLCTKDRWYGVTYQEDKPMVVAALKQMRENGWYPMHLWEDVKA
jgi:dTDP-glucose pyrophosphorylase